MKLKLGFLRDKRAVSKILIYFIFRMEAVQTSKLKVQRKGEREGRLRA